MILRAAAIAISLIAAPCAAQDGNADIRAVADAFDMAQFHRDKAALEAMIAPDYLAVFGSGRIVGRTEFIGGFTGPDMTFEPFEITDRLFLRIAPDAAVVGGEGRRRHRARCRRRWRRRTDQGNRERPTFLGAFPIFRHVRQA